MTYGDLPSPSLTPGPHSPFGATVCPQYYLSFSLYPDPSLFPFPSSLSPSLGFCILCAYQPVPAPSSQGFLALEMLDPDVKRQWDLRTYVLLPPCTTAPLAGTGWYWSMKAQCPCLCVHKRQGYCPLWSLPAVSG